MNFEQENIKSCKLGKIIEYNYDHNKAQEIIALIIKLIN